MKFMVMIKGNENHEASLAPNPELMEAIGRHTVEMMQAGVVLETGGLLPSSQGARVRLSKGTLSVLDGPFAEAKELIGGYWFIVAQTLDDAAAIAAENPCIAFGLSFEIRPLEAQRASVYRPANETPAAWKQGPA